MPREQTGRTTALLQDAIEHAKRGEHVIFYVATWTVSEYARALAESLLRAPILRDGHSSGFAGRLRFVVLRRRWDEIERARYRRGMPNAVEVFDHFWPLHDS